jgi:hypothetical protein
MTGLIQILCRKVSEVRIRQKALELRNRSADRSLADARAHSFEFCEPRPMTARHRRRDHANRE